MNLTIKEQDETIVTRISGRFDTAAAQEVDMQPLIQLADKKIIFDCAEMEFISSAGLRQLLTLYRECKAKNGEIVMRNVAPGVMRVFQVAGFKPLFAFE